MPGDDQVFLKGESVEPIRWTTIPDAHSGCSWPGRCGSRCDPDPSAHRENQPAVALRCPQRSPTSIHVPDISAHTLQGSLLDRFYPPLPCLPAVLFTACYGADSIIISICQNAKVGTFDRAQHIAVGDPQEQLHFRLEPNFAVAIPFKLGSNPLQQL